MPMNEERLVKKLIELFKQPGEVLAGPGDDCAVLDLGLPELLLAAVDQVISGVHYRKGCPPAYIAGKLLKRNLSDIAAMGGVPTHVLLALAVNPMDETWLMQFHEALAQQAKNCGVAVVGGDLGRLFTPGEALSLTILGRVERDKLCLRSGAEKGDLLCATGCFGNSLYSGHHLDFTPRLKEARFLAGKFTRTMVDVSDGLLKDAARLADASGLALKLDPDKVPLRHGASVAGALTDGEDYELLFALPKALRLRLECAWPFPDTPLTCLGEFIPGASGKITGPEKWCLKNHHPGYDHFQ